VAAAVEAVVVEAGVAAEDVESDDAPFHEGVGFELPRTAREMLEYARFERSFDEPD
jgi:hypothetical protein